MLPTTRTRSLRYGFSLETKEEHSRATMPMRSTALDEPCSRVFDVTKEEPARTRRLASTPIKREKRRKEKERETWVGLDGRKERMRDEASMLYLSADVGQGRTAGFQLYRYLSGDNDRMAIAGVAVPQPSEVDTQVDIPASIHHSPRSSCASRHATACNNRARAHGRTKGDAGIEHNIQSRMNRAREFRKLGV